MRNDLRQALAKTVSERGINVMRQDSIRAYRMMAKSENETMTIAVCDESRADYSFATVWALSDQRLPMWLSVHLTPMQRQLMEMFFTSPSHRLTKQEICDALWPKKEDASDTLYTMIRRLKQELGKSSSLRIESDRGRAYILTDSEMSDKCQ